MLRAVTILSAMTVIGIVALEYLRPGANNITTIEIMVGFTAPTILSLLGLMRAQENANILAASKMTLENIDKQINGHLKEILLRTGDNTDNIKGILADIVKERITAQITSQNQPR